MSKDDPYNDNKTYHKASKVHPNGSVSALCYKRPKAIDLSKTLWTIRDEAVTCPLCLKLIKETP